MFWAVDRAEDTTVYRQLLPEASGAFVDGLRTALGKLAKARTAAQKAKDEAKAMQAKVIPAMGAVRDACDALEGVVPADLWPLPTYREMLFVK